MYIFKLTYIVFETDVYMVSKDAFVSGISLITFTQIKIK